MSVEAAAESTGSGSRACLATAKPAIAAASAGAQLESCIRCLGYEPLECSFGTPPMSPALTGATSHASVRDSSAAISSPTDVAVKVRPARWR